MAHNPNNGNKKRKEEQSLSCSSFLFYTFNNTNV